MKIRLKRSSSISSATVSVGTSAHRVVGVRPVSIVRGECRFGRFMRDDRSRSGQRQCPRGPRLGLSARGVAWGSAVRS